MALADKQDTLTAFFRYVDRDNDGYITVAEIQEACAVDLNGDGQISEAEKITCAKPWLDEYLAQQDLNQDQKVSLQELLVFNGCA